MTIKSENHVTPRAVNGTLLQKAAGFINSNPRALNSGKELLAFYSNVLSPDEKRFIAGEYYDRDSTWGGKKEIRHRLMEYFRNNMKSGDAIENISFPVSLIVEDRIIMNEIRDRSGLINADLKKQAQSPELSSFAGKPGTLKAGQCTLAAGSVRQGKKGDFLFEVTETVFDSVSGTGLRLSEALSEVPVSLSVEAGRICLPAEKVLSLAPESKVKFDRDEQGPFDLVMDMYDTPIARGELVMFEDETIGLRITDVLPEYGVLLNGGTPARRNIITAGRDIPVRCVIGRCGTDYGTLISLGAGSVIRLDRKTYEQSDVYIGSNLKVKGEIVSADGRICVQLDAGTDEDGCYRNDIESFLMEYEPDAYLLLREKHLMESLTPAGTGVGETARETEVIDPEDVIIDTGERSGGFFGTAASATAEKQAGNVWRRKEEFPFDEYLVTTDEESESIPDEKGVAYDREIHGLRVFDDPEKFNSYVREGIEKVTPEAYADLEHDLLELAGREPERIIKPLINWLDTDRREAALFMFVIGSDNAARVMELLPDFIQEQLTFEIARTGDVYPETFRRIIIEGALRIKGIETIHTAGIDYGRDVLEKGLGTGKAIEIIERLTECLQVSYRYFELVGRLEAKLILELLENELPQTIALVLSYLDPEKLAEAIDLLPETIKVDVIRRIAEMKRVNQDVVREIERIMERKAVSYYNSMQPGGTEYVVEMISSLGKNAGRSIIGKIEKIDALLAASVVDRLMPPQILAMLNDSAVKMVIHKSDCRTLAHALKGTDADTCARIEKCVPASELSDFRHYMSGLDSVSIQDVYESREVIAGIVEGMKPVPPQRG